MKKYLIISFIVFMSCDTFNPIGDLFHKNDNFDETHSGGSFQVRFSEGTAQNSSRGILVNGNYIGEIDYLSRYYETLGDEISLPSITPESFILSIGRGFVIGNENTSMHIGPEWNSDQKVEEQENSMHVDFCNPDKTLSASDITADTYDTFSFGFASFPRDLNTNLYEYPRLIVQIPGYTDSEWPDLTIEKSVAGEIVGETYLRKYLGDNKFQLSLSMVYPHTLDSSFNRAGNELETFIFSSFYDEPGVVLPGIDEFPESINTLDYANNPSGSTGNMGLLVMPFDPIEINDNTELVVYIDLDGIIKVYDNFTPENKSDDLLILENGFWNRFTFEVNEIQP